MRWLREPVVLTRLVLIFASVGLGLMAGAGVVLGTVALNRAANERQDRLMAERDARRREDDRLRRALVTEAEVAKIARRVVALERPSDARLAALLRNAVLACRRTPSCRSVVIVEQGSGGDIVLTQRPRARVPAVRPARPERPAPTVVVPVVPPRIPVPRPVPPIVVPKLPEIPDLPEPLPPEPLDPVRDLVCELARPVCA
jgi:hypothetical protein